MKKGLSEIVCIVDRSYSMSSIKSSAIEGFNSFLAAQKKCKGEATFTLTQFNTNYHFTQINVPISRATELNGDSYVTEGGTALYDAIGRTIDTVGARLADTAEHLRPEKVIVSILTDGEENSSNDYTRERIAEMISTQQDVFNWEFVFLAANQDAWLVGQTFGIKKQNAINFAATDVGIRAAYSTMDVLTTGYRTK